jgi:hypothetical protein
MQSKQVLWLCGVLAVGGCGEDLFDDSRVPDPESEDDGDDAQDDSEHVPALSRSGLDGSHVVGELDGAEASALCGWASASYGALLGEDLGQTCTLFAGGYGANAEECALLVDACVTDLQASGFVDTESASCSDDLLGCSATVGEIEACLMEQYAALEALLGAVSCEGGLPAEVEAQYSEIGPACAVVSAKCADFFDDDAPEQTFACDSDVFDETVPMRVVCDGRADCSNGTDEVGCEATLRKFVCDDGTVIPQGSVCDGGFDCPTGEDESCP